MAISIYVIRRTWKFCKLAKFFYTTSACRPRLSISSIFYESKQLWVIETQKWLQLCNKVVKSTRSYQSFYCFRACCLSLKWVSTFHDTPCVLFISHCLAVSIPRNIEEMQAAVWRYRNAKHAPETQIPRSCVQRSAMGFSWLGDETWERWGQFAEVSRTWNLTVFGAAKLADKIFAWNFGCAVESGLVVSFDGILRGISIRRGRESRGTVG